MKKKITAAVMAATMIISAGAVLAEKPILISSNPNQAVEVEATPKYIQYAIEVKSADQTQVVAEIEGVETTFKLTEDTLLISKTRDLPKEGDKFVVLVDAAAPAPAVYPPVYTAYALVKTEGAVFAGVVNKVDDEKLAAEDGSIEIVPGETGYTVDDLDGKEIIAAYQMATFSLPAIAVADMIVVLDNEEEEVTTQEVPYKNPYIMYDITITAMEDDSIIATYEGGEATFKLTEDSIMSSKTKDMPQVGETVKVVIDGREPMILPEPPVYTVAALVRGEENVYAGQFNKVDGKLVSLDNTLALNIEDEAVVDDYDDNDLLVVYGASTRSIPAQTEPTFVAILEDNNAAFADFLKGEAQRKQDENCTDIDVYVDKEKVDFTKYSNVLPFVEDDYTLVPLRAIAEALGCEVEYDDTTKTVTIKNEKITVELVLNADTAKVNGEEVKLSKEAKVVSDRTMVPARFVSESMGYDVDWDQDSLSVLVD